MMRADEMREILDLIEYKDWALVVSTDGESTPWLKWTFDAPDIYTGETEKQHCRKWQLSYHMTNSELIRTAYKAALAAEEHECSENFLFSGEMIFDPHMDLVGLACNRADIGQDFRS